MSDFTQSIAATPSMPNAPAKTTCWLCSEDSAPVTTVPPPLDRFLRVIRKTTWQGYDDDSCWSRGQARSIYGFTLAHKATEEEVFLSVAEKLADYFIKNLPADYVPYWNFNDPRIPNAPRDSSAAAIACSGLMTLSKLNGKKKFMDMANRILSSLSTNYIAEESCDGILKHGCFHMPKKVGVDESLIWGDYYFLEALMKSSDEPQDGE
ncbi:MAG: glycoside hydrolase family 88 protein [Hadesarchaea archaeon]|nr:glycoside hydrolase family 88 protein [Hadesarchaea archaeon]